MSERIRCFLLTPARRERVSLRRFCFTGGPKDCEFGFGYHDASAVIIASQATTYQRAIGDEHPHDDARWPKKCQCGYEFSVNDGWQIRYDPLYERSDTRELVTLNESPAGAMWFADWMLTEGSDAWRGPDGRCLVVRTPGGDWMVDGQATNCAKPHDREHRCWIRHGTAPDVHVDKTGNTCNAGAGSISIGGYHGFLQHGELVG